MTALQVNHARVVDMERKKRQLVHTRRVDAVQQVCVGSAHVPKQDDKNLILKAHGAIDTRSRDRGSPTHCLDG